MLKENLVAIPTNPNVMRFNVTLNESCRNEKLRVQVERKKSGANKYGNQTSVAVYVNESLFQLFDTRYNVAMNTIEGFQEYFTAWVEDMWKENASSIERIL